jgi:hypothetical protein
MAVVVSRHIVVVVVSAMVVGSTSAMIALFIKHAEDHPSS